MEDVVGFMSPMVRPMSTANYRVPQCDGGIVQSVDGCNNATGFFSLSLAFNLVFALYTMQQMPLFNVNFVAF